MKELDKKKALILLSGGQDSAACLGWSIREWGATNLLAVTFDYGQRHKVEIEVARSIASRLHVQQSIFAFDLLKELGGSALMKSHGPLQGSIDNLPVTFVPGRNILFLSIAATIAYQSSIANVVIGVSNIDYSGYPDCRPDFISAMADALARGLEANIVLHAPLQNRTKAEVFKLAEECGVLSEVLDSHTCYAGVRDVVHPWGRGCGVCQACLLRAKGYHGFLAMIDRDSHARER